ncbi:hypothetical protein HMPREF0514_10368 [Lactobacillus paragasseri JV-V03]|uniref:Uncharacterized protein n=1 Tax=Lactobacillus paragasseri JV-V03 TaxID=525326 RepID=A0AA87AMB5_9LACO|nr:hypothetical protein HMPREF0514_10368 [Lactobacillus paragasseri JV-V03]
MVQQEALIFTASLQKVFPIVGRLFCFLLFYFATLRIKLLTIKRKTKL